MGRGEVWDSVDGLVREEGATATSLDYKFTR